MSPTPRPQLQFPLSRCQPVPCHPLLSPDTICWLRISSYFNSPIDPIEISVNTFLQMEKRGVNNIQLSKVSVVGRAHTSQAPFRKGLRLSFAWSWVVACLSQDDTLFLGQLPSRTDPLRRDFGGSPAASWASFETALQPPSPSSQSFSLPFLCLDEDANSTP